MPYIDKHLRYKLEDGAQMKSAGELNYQFTTTIKAYFEANGMNYAKINDVIGALEGAKLELYRRLVAPYEDTKIEENGDVY